MRRIATYLLAFVFLTIIGTSVVDYAIGLENDQYPPYNRAFASIGANFLESRLDCWAKIKTDSDHDYQQQLMEIGRALGLKVDPSRLYKTADYSLQFYEVLDYTKYCIILREADESTAYLTITVASEKNPRLVNTCKSELNKLSGFEWQFYQLYMGVIDMVVDPDGYDLLLEVVLKNMDAQMTEKLKDQNFITATAKMNNQNTKYFNLYQSDKAFDVQVAIRRDAANGQTLIWLGSPLILTDF